MYPKISGVGSVVVIFWFSFGGAVTRGGDHDTPFERANTILLDHFDGATSATSSPIVRRVRRAGLRSLRRHRTRLMVLAPMA